MADNTRLPIGTLDGDIYASDDIGSVKFQRVKVTLGADGANDGDLSSTNPLPVAGTLTNKPTGAPNMANGQVSLSGTAGTIVAARATRRSVAIINTDSSLAGYVGIATVTAGNGFLLGPKQSISLDFTGLIQGIAPSGGPVFAYVETYD